ncbi:MAG TPA: sugar phosphate nucleotidyltransferase [Thermoanaerobaculia bacterium]|nr:sugar phosphate nucleotidyltransferase [Thermoanaerobaculia bacterium]
MKAVVLAAGIGSRMRRPDPGADLDAEQRSAADRGLKALVPIAGRPFLDHALSRLADAGILDVVLVVGPSTRAIRDHYEASCPGRVHLAFAEQPEPRGSADALLAAERFADGGEFLAMNSDDLYPVSALRGLRTLGGPGLPVFERRALLEKSNFSPERIGGFAVLRLDPGGFLGGIVEKPDSADLSAPDGEVLLSMNLWRFPPAIFDACRRVPESVRGEQELPQAVGLGIASGTLRLATFRCDEPVLDLTTRGDVAVVSERLRGVEARP